MDKQLVVDLYELTMAQVFFKEKREAIATFDLYIRSPKRPWYVALGIEDAITSLMQFSFSKEDIEYLKSLTLFEEEFLKYLSQFKFSGEVWAVDEPEIIFPREPLIRVTASLLEAQIIESMLLNTINLAVTLATKAVRVILASQGRSVYDFSLRRTQGVEAAVASAVYSYIAGCKGTSNLRAGKLYNIPVVGTMAHSFVMSYEREIESFLAFSKQFPSKCILLVDTYDIHEGIHNAIRVAKKLRTLGCGLLGIRLDSGNLAEDARYARILLDQHGLIDVSIFASGNLDEFKIAEIMHKRAPIDAFGVGTNMGCSSDLPSTDVIYKIVELKEAHSHFVPTMKVSPDKLTLPGRKQIYRVCNKEGMMVKDFIGLEKESLTGRKLLKPIMKKGNLVITPKPIKRKRKLLLEKIKMLPNCFKEIVPQTEYPVLLSENLSRLCAAVRKDISRRIKPRIVFFDIDTQNDFFPPKGALAARGAEDILPHVRQLTSYAQNKGFLVVASQDTHRKGDPEFKEFSPHCVKGEKGWQKVKGTMLPKHKAVSYRRVLTVNEMRKYIASYAQIIFEKNTLNPFSNPNLGVFFELTMPDQVYVYGLITEYCVREAVNWLIKNQFPVVVVEDAICEVSFKEKERIFSTWRRQGVLFMNTQAVINRFNDER